MKNVIKIMMIIIMLLGIVFSLSNFISLELNADGNLGYWEIWPDGKECIPPGSDCTTNFEEPGF